MMTKSEWELLGDTQRELALTMYDRARAHGITDLVVLDAALLMQSTAAIFNHHQRKKHTMESYTFRCVNDDCGHYDQSITGITMQRVIDDGGPVCGFCGADLELVGPDDGADAHDARRNAPTAYRPVPGPPVNRKV